MLIGLKGLNTSILTYLEVPADNKCLSFSNFSFLTCQQPFHKSVIAAFGFNRIDE